MTTANKTKITLNSLIFSAAPVLPELKEGEKRTKTQEKEFEKDLADHINVTSTNLAEYFIERSPIDLEVVQRILAETSKAIPSVLKDMQERKEAEEKRKEEERAKRLAEEEEERNKQIQLAEEQKEKVLQAMLDLGLDLEVAKAAAETAGQKLMPAVSGAKHSYDRIECKIEGKLYQVPVRGNMSQELKDLAAKYNFSDDRDGMIEKFRTIAPEAEKA